jgi:hypothetical protein
MYIDNMSKVFSFICSNLYFMSYRQIFYQIVFGTKQREATGWQEGYGAFTYSIREKDMIINYLKNQKEHHKSESFYDEYKRLLIENGVVFDEKYLL